jgi:hypothetical protein
VWWPYYASGRGVGGAYYTPGYGGGDASDLVGGILGSGQLHQVLLGDGLNLSGLEVPPPLRAQVHKFDFFLKKFNPNYP